MRLGRGAKSSGQPAAQPARVWGTGPRLRPAATGTDPSQFAMPAPFASLAAPPLFITGEGRSGTTMVFDLFTRHPDVHAIFESWLLTPYSGITQVLHQPQWSPEFYEGQLESVGYPHAVAQLLPYADAARELGELAASWLVRGMAPGKRYFVEKTPLDVAVVPALFPGARVAHIIRDGRDVAGSVRRASDSWAPEMNPEQAAGSWRARVGEIREHGQKLGDDYTEFRFEDLRADLETQARRLFDFGRIPLTDEQLADALAATSSDAYSDRVKQSGFRGAGAVDGWRGWMTRADGQEFDAVAGDLLVELGYASDRDWWRQLPKGR
jgi:hypothetical protein